MTVLMALYQRSLALDEQVAHWGGAALGLFLRLYVGWQFFKAGMVKIADWSATLALFREEYHVPLLAPELAAYLGAAGELVLPLLLFAGLLSRPAALALLLVNCMAVLSYPQLFSFECPAAINDHFYWGVMLLALAVYGPGRISLDAWLGRPLR
ncbi:DoxX family protein [Pseudoduganella danionis]|uniref:DoxX family protein n=1 Tax=Pseudoduganella danionis TaxID=1890295 RepID=UPI0035B15B07